MPLDPLIAFFLMLLGWAALILFTCRRAASEARLRPVRAVPRDLRAEPIPGAESS